MLKQKTQDIEVGGKKYRLTKIDARTGSYVAAKLALIAAPLLTDKKFDEKTMAALVPNLSRRDFDEIQTILLKSVLKLNEAKDNLLPEPILKSDGSFVDEELEYDAASVMNLTAQAAMFNVGAFFAAAGLAIPAK